MPATDQVPQNIDVAPWNSARDQIAGHLLADRQKPRDTDIEWNRLLKERQHAKRRENDG